MEGGRASLGLGCTRARCPSHARDRGKQSLCVALLLSPCSLQHNTIKEDGATFLAEALLTNHRLTTLQ